MSIAGSLHYWFVMLFLQFAPATDLTPGRLIVYRFSGQEIQSGDLAFRVQEGSSPVSRRFVSVLAFPGGSESVMKARIELREGEWFVNELIDNGRPMLAAGETLSLQTNQLDRILISTDGDYFFQRVSGATRRSCLGFVVPGLREARFEEGRNRVDLEVHSRRGIQDARIEFFEPRISGRITRVPSGQ